MLHPKIIILSLIAMAGVSATAQTKESGQGDKLLNTLRHELDYNFSQLQKQEIRPYFMSYRADDIYQDIITSDMGVLLSDNEQHQRIVTPQVRVGDMQLDNFKFTTQGMPSQGREATTVTIPFDDNATEAIATNIWTATLDRYRMAQLIYEQTKSKAATSSADEDKAPCFSSAPVENYYEAALPQSRTRIDRKAWEQRLNAVTAVFAGAPDLTQGTASLDFNVTRTWLVNTDGTNVVQNRVTARVILSVQTMADDGMELPLMQDFFAFSPDSLPSVDSMKVVAADLVKRVMALRRAPVANPYTGPAILSGAASGVFFHEIFGHRLEGHRLKQGGETFRKMVGKEVLPKTFQVYSDPTLRTLNGQDLNGYYLYDSEGVKARRVNNVVDGVLKEFLMSRVPLDGFPQSNGHGRAAGANDAVSRQSNLCVETKAPLTDAQLRAQLIRECRLQGKDYGYYFKTVTSGYTMTGEQGSINSFNVTPVEVYRVYVDGRPDELVRGVSLIGTPLSMFSHIKYGGGRQSTFTGTCGAESGWVPVTASSPAIFVTQIETQRDNKGRGVPPVLQSPRTASPLPASAPEAEVIRQAMGDELHRSLDSLHITGAKAPFWISYMVNRYRRTSIKAELGGATKVSQKPWQTNIVDQVRLGNFRDCSDIMKQPLLLGTETAQQITYGSLRRFFWIVSDAAYKNSINQMAKKENYLLQNPKTATMAKIPDMQHSAPVVYHEQTVAMDADSAKLKNIAEQMSAVFKDYPYVINTSVNIDATELQSYRLTSEGVDLSLPHNHVTIQVRADTKDGDNISVGDNLTLSYESVEEMPSADSLKARVRRFAESCNALRNAPQMSEYYKGPVMFDGEAVMRVLTGRLLRANSFYAQPSMREAQNSLGEKIGKKIMDPRITIRNLTATTSFEGKPLYGHYNIDAEGFKPAPEMTLVDKGVFKMMLNVATPAQYALKSTGSARLANSPDESVPMVGVGTLAITAEGTTPQEKMERELLKAAKKKKLDCAYIVTADDDQTSLRLYRIDVKTGARTLLKTNALVLPSMDQLKEFVAISAESKVKNFVNPYTYSVIYPRSIIFGDMEINKSTFKPSPSDPLPYPLQR